MVFDITYDWYDIISGLKYYHMILCLFPTKTNILWCCLFQLTQYNKITCMVKCLVTINEHDMVPCFKYSMPIWHDISSNYTLYDEIFEIVSPEICQAATILHAHGISWYFSHQILLNKISHEILNLIWLQTTYTYM